MITAFFDAGCRGKGGPGPSACGALIWDEDGELLTPRQFLGTTTVNVAEWSGLILTLENILKNFHYYGQPIEIYSDSLLVVRQALGEWRVKKQELRPYRDKASALASKLRAEGCSVRISHVPREENEEADRLVSTFLDSYTGRRR